MIKITKQFLPFALCFAIYMHSYGISFYGDDTQIYIPIGSHDSSHIQIESCLTAIKRSMSQNDLQLNTRKTELISNTLFFKDSTISQSSCVKNLGVLLDPMLSFDQHFKSITRTAFFHLRNIAKIRPMLSHPCIHIVAVAPATHHSVFCWGPPTQDTVCLWFEDAFIGDGMMVYAEQMVDATMTEVSRVCVDSWFIRDRASKTGRSLLVLLRLSL